MLMTRLLKTYHGVAIDLAEMAFFFQEKGIVERARMIFADASKYERLAADVLRNQSGRESDCAILYRSAGWLAYSAQRYDEALECAELGLVRNPRRDIQRELEELRAHARAINHR